MKIISLHWLERLDTLGHKLHLPKWIFGPICDEYERRLLDSFVWGWEYVNANTTSSSGATFSFKRKRHDER